MKKMIGLVLAGGVTLAVLTGYLVGQPLPKPADPPPARPAAALEEKAMTDADAVRAAGESFVKAYTSGDAKAMASHWTENGEYHADDGTTLRGRENIQKAYAKLFAKKKKEKVRAEIEVTSIRFPSKDTAVEEGYFKVRVGKEAATSHKYTVLHAREGGKWLMAIVREFPGEGVSLRDLEWLIGTWEAKREGTEVRTTYEWWGENKAFIRAAISIKTEGRSVNGFQMIGKDAATGEIRSWAFDAGGSFSQATWERDGKKWVQDTAAVIDDGSTVASTNIITRVDDDTFTFQSVERSKDGEELDDIPPIRVTRVKVKGGRP